MNARSGDFIESVNFTNEMGKDLPKISFLRYDNEQFSLNYQYKIKFLDKYKMEAILNFYNKSECIICEIIDEKDSQITANFTCFAFKCVIFYEPFYIGIDEILENLNKNQSVSNDEIQKIFKEKFSIEINGKVHYLVNMGAKQDELFGELPRLKKQKEKLEKQKSDNLNFKDDEKLDKINKKINEILAQNFAFSLIGDENILGVQKQNISSDEVKFKATKIQTLNKRDFPNLRLWQVDIEFEDKTTKTLNKQIANIVKEGAFLKAWDKYIEKEGEKLLKNAREFGYLSEISKKQRVEFGYKISFNLNEKDFRDFDIKIGDYISITNNKPSYLDDKNITWGEYIKQSGDGKFEGEKSFKIIGISSNALEIECNLSEQKLDELLKNSGVILSIYGDETQFRRKFEARQRLLEGKAANPYLGLILEDDDSISEYLSDKKGDFISLSKNVKNKIFKQNPPTQNQLDAIEIALNTPDIAIIQGPPGTGKTTVINAIIEMLNEISDKRENNYGKVLITSFQHDAVNNIISRMRVNGLPTMKFGKRMDDETDITNYENIIAWSEEIVNQMDNLTFSEAQSVMNLQALFESYTQAPGESKERKILEYIVSINKISENLRNRAGELLKILRQKDSKWDLSAIYGIRTSVKSFEDDGVNQNAKAYMKFKEFLNDDERKILQRVGKVDEVYINELKKIRVKLIEQFYPYKSYQIPKPKAEILRLKDEVENELKNVTIQDKINFILARYINNIQSNPLSLKEVLNAYSFVYAATTGQSLGKDIVNTKQKRKKSYDLNYKAVIVDEAARVAPMDLLIVMVQAKEKIILVGDHRQLPHIYDEAFLDSTFSEKEQKLIEISAFEYLIERAKKLENIDNKKRFITLNNQYRMHPLLGNFINENFYEKHNEGFFSPLKESIFTHNLKGIENLPCVCIDVPNFPHKRSASGSSFRESEVEAIDRYLSIWSDENLSCGVISFYSEQVNLLNKKLEIYKDKFKSFKIGSVDAFQGMEFDIVFLSAVRSVINPQNERDFGFLVSKNRVCVSMSRQKKVLVFVGNLECYESDLAKQCVGEISNFITLCKTHGKILR